MTEFATMVNDDPWAHRHEGMVCKTCMWSVEKAVKREARRAIDSAAKASGLVVGRCRKRAPTMDGYPVIFMDDWCGSHKLDETKV